MFGPDKCGNDHKVAYLSYVLFADFTLCTLIQFCTLTRDECVDAVFTIN